jgi:hypothetical protein
MRYSQGMMKKEVRLGEVGGYGIGLSTVVVTAQETQQ